MEFERVFVTTSAEETVEIAKDFSLLLKKGSVVALWGDLGVGKTTFTKGIALGLGIPSSVAVTSPTFTIVNEYEGSLHLYHMDFYRISNVSDLDLMALRELIWGDGVTVIEWPDRMGPHLPKERWDIFLEIRSDTERLIKIVNNTY